jgi:hypothetical protein
MAGRTALGLEVHRSDPPGGGSISGSPRGKGSMGREGLDGLKLLLFG